MKRWWIIFADSDAPQLRFLKKGFRHLWIQGYQDGNWISVDLMGNSLDIELSHIWLQLPAPPKDDAECAQREKEIQDSVIAWWKQQGYTAVEVTPRAAGMNWYCSLMTCVTVAKRFLGIHAPFIQTPHQLYRRLTA